MTTTIGFVILSHDNPQQLRRLVQTLRRLYDDPPIAIHHDFSQSACDPSDIAGAAFVKPHIFTRWGKFSIVRATMLALELLYTISDPDWFILLSASDYPVMPADRVRDDLASLMADALIDYRQIPQTGPATQVPGTLPCLAPHGNDLNVRLARNRYLKAIVRIPMLRKGSHPGVPDPRHTYRIGAYTLCLPFASPASPFGDGLACYVGSQWFSGRRSVARFLLTPSDKAKHLARYLAPRPIPDEVYFHSLLVNDRRFCIDPNSRRYADWTDGGWGPHAMDHARVMKAIGMETHFARKFLPDSPELDYLDERLGR